VRLLVIIVFVFSFDNYGNNEVFLSGIGCGLRM
jgi:hypothetical protein